MEFTPAPKRPDPPLAEVHVWRAAAGATPSERVLRRVLASYLGEEPERIPLARGEHGKPRLTTEPGRLSFNLSHSGELTLVAVSCGREVGVDVERAKPARDLVALAARAFGPEEATAVRAATGDERTRLFYELWTRHEARLKCLGVGLAGASTEPVAAVAVETLPVDAGYAAAVAMTGPAVPIRCWTLD
ncbi:MAG TPA: 4'-phosphopantetheinyl transferase superfamily protein [Solirubrobacterales bacterium]|nr:4'-phosphopantetheinyl transferase superfamily protein [Solirubrobacterales bacterium]